MNKTTVLVYINPNAPVQGLRVATQKEWSEILEVNATLPRAERRFFIEDVIQDRGLDRMFIESSKEEYDKWHSEQTEKGRQLQLKKEMQFCSLDVTTVQDAERVTLGDTIEDPADMEEKVLDEILIEQLREALSAKYSWGAEMLDQYLAGNGYFCTEQMAAADGVSKQMIAKRKKKFVAFVKNFLSTGV